MRIEAVDLAVCNVPAPGVMDRSPEKPGARDSTHLRAVRPGNAPASAPQVVVVRVRTNTGLEGRGFGWGVKGGMRLAHTIA